MKKFILIIFIFLLSINYQEQTISTFSEKSENSFYILEFPNYNLSTNNFEKYFNNIQVVWIEVDYKYNIKKRYNFSNINKFKSDFLSQLELKNYKEEKIELNISGIIINKMKVYTNIDKIKKINIENMIVNY